MASKKRDDILYKSNSDHIPVAHSTIRIITTYNTQHREVNKLLNKNWHILLSDSVMASILDSNPKITYRKGASPHDRFVHSDTDPATSTGASGTQATRRSNALTK